MRIILCYITSILSLLACLGYFSPWLAAPGVSNNILGAYVLSLLWFMGAWIILMIHIIFTIILRKIGDNKWKHHAIAAGIIFVCYIALGIGLTNELFLTV